MREYVRAIGKGPYNPPQNYPSSERARARNFPRERSFREVNLAAGVNRRSLESDRERSRNRVNRRAGESGTDRSPITRLLSAETISSG